MAMASKAEIQKGQKHFMETLGNIPEPIRAMIDYAPDMFVGYLTMREAIYRQPPAGALDLKTKELIFALLDTVIGATDGAKAHAANAVRLGLTVEQLAEGLVQCILAAGITTWNMTGQSVLRHAIEVRGTLPASPGS